MRDQKEDKKPASEKEETPVPETQAEKPRRPVYDTLTDDNPLICRGID